MKSSKPYTNKYLYYKIIQGRFANRWEDLNQYAANSKGAIENREDKERRVFLRECREDFPDTTFRTVFRRELNAYYARFPEKKPW